LGFFLSRQIWGLVADRIGGLRTIFAGSVCQLVAMVGFLATQSEAGLFTVSAVFGLGFSGSGYAPQDAAAQTGC
jgi:nitrate/nitrite transporter NarK